MSQVRAERPLTSLIWQEKAVFFTVFGACTLAGIAYYVLAPAVWEARATIVFPVKQPSILGTSGLGEATAGLAALAGGPTPLKVYEGILESQRTLNFVARNVDKKPRDIKDMRQILDQTAENSITISAKSKDGDFAKKVVALHIEALNKINKTLSGPLGADDVAAIGKQLAKEKAKLHDAEVRLQRFQQTAQTAPSVVSGGDKQVNIVPIASRWAESAKGIEIELDRVTAALKASRARIDFVAASKGDVPIDSPTITAWRDKLAQAEFNLQVALLTLAPHSVEAEKLRDQIKLAKARLQNEVHAYVTAADNGLNGGSGDKGTTPDLILQQVGLSAQLQAVRRLAELAPAESIELARRTREVATEGTVVAQLEAQYSLAALQQGRDPNRWELLDEPEVDDKPVNKGLGKNIGLGVGAGLFLGGLAALSRSGRRRSRNLEPLEAAE